MLSLTSPEMVSILASPVDRPSISTRPLLERAVTEPPGARSWTLPLTVWALTSPDTGPSSIEPDAVLTFAVAAEAIVTRPDTLLTSASPVMVAALTCPDALSAVSEPNSPRHVMLAEAVSAVQWEPAGTVMTNSRLASITRQPRASMTSSRPSAWSTGTSSG